MAPFYKLPFSLHKFLPPNRITMQGVEITLLQTSRPPRHPSADSSWQKTIMPSVKPVNTRACWQFSRDEFCFTPRLHIICIRSLGDEDLEGHTGRHKTEDERRYIGRSNNRIMEDSASSHRYITEIVTASEYS